MPENKPGQNHPNKIDHDKKKAPETRFGWIVVLGLVLVGSLLVATFLPKGDVPERLKFLTVNLLNVLLFLAIVVQSLIYRRQSNLMEGQLDAMNEQAGIAKGQLDAMLATERPYIAIIDLAIGNDYGKVDLNQLVGKNPILHVTWHNGGKTPAMHFRTIPYLVYGEKPERRGYFIDDDWSDIKGSFLPPGNSRTMPYSQAETGFNPMDQVMIDDLIFGKKRLYAVVIAVYVDFTGETKSFETAAIYDQFSGNFVELQDYFQHEQ